MEHISEMYEAGINNLQGDAKAVMMLKCIYRAFCILRVMQTHNSDPLSHFRFSELVEGATECGRRAWQA
jgi:hypothetical protein